MKTINSRKDSAIFGAQPAFDKPLYVGRPNMRSQKPKKISTAANEGVNDLFSLIKENPGKRTPFFAQQLNTSVKNIERWLKHLKLKFF